MDRRTPVALLETHGRSITEATYFPSLLEGCAAQTLSVSGLFKERNSPVTFSHTNQDAMAVAPNRRKTLGFDPLAIAKGSVALTG